MEERHEWTPGELITASKLNAIESFLTNISTNFVSTQGSTINGNIVYKLTNVDLAQTNNGIDAKLYPAIAIFQDNNEKSFARVEGAVWSDNEEEDFKGSTWVTIWARNYKTSDKTEVTNALRLGVNKNGKLLVKFTDEEKEAWRRALGIISESYISLDNAIFHDTGSTEAQSILTPLTTTHYFGGTTSGGPWAEGKDKALLRNFASSSNDVFIPTVSMLSPNGSWTIGTYRDNSLRFVYYNNSNSYSYSIDPSGVFSGTASKITSRTLTIGNTGKTFNGTANVSWSLSEIGAAAASHSHSNITARWGSSKGTKPSSDSWLLGSFSHESGTGTSVSNRLAGFENQIDTSGTSWFWIRAYQNTSGSSAQNYLAIGKKQDGTSMVSVSDAAAWRTALGLGTAATQASTAFAAASHTHSYLPLSGGTMTGTITLANTGFKTPNVGGYVTDDYGNFKHQSTTTTNTWTIMNKAGTGTFAVNFESGVISKGKWQSTPVGVIYGGTGAATPTNARRNLGIDTGATDTFSINGNACITHSVGFNRAFASAPNVVVGLGGGPSTSSTTSLVTAAPKWGRVSVRVIEGSISTTGFQYQISCYGSENVDKAKVYWIAVGEPTIVA